MLASDTNTWTVLEKAKVTQLNVGVDGIGDVSNPCNRKILYTVTGIEQTVSKYQTIISKDHYVTEVSNSH